MRTKLLVSGLCGAAAAAPAVALAAAPAEPTPAQPGSAANPLDAAMRTEANAQLEKLRRRALHRAAVARARRRRRRLAAEARSSSSTGGSSAPAVLQAIAQCESGGDPTAVSGPYGGKYQFDAATWASVGGTGNPADAPASEQDMRAEMLYAREGTTPWPVCGRGR